MTNNEKYQYNTISDAMRYLKSMGWKTSSKTIYRHIGLGKIPDKPWTQETLDRYAAEHLRPGGAGDAVTRKDIKSSAKGLLEDRRRKMAVEIDLKNFELAQKRGDYMPVSEHSREMCAKLYLIRDTVFNWIRENAGELISVSRGDAMFTDELVAAYQKSFVEYWGRLDTSEPWPILPVSGYDKEPILK